MVCLNCADYFNNLYIYKTLEIDTCIIIVIRIVVHELMFQFNTICKCCNCLQLLDDIQSNMMISKRTAPFFLSEGTV